MDRLFDRLGDLLRTVLGGDGGTTTGAGRRQGRPSHIDDPDLAAAWDELDDFLDSDDPRPEPAAQASGSYRPGEAGAGRTAAKKDPRDHLSVDYETLEVAFGAPMSDVKRAYKRLIQRHHPDRFASDPRRQAAATRQGRPHQRRLHPHRTRPPRHLNPAGTTPPFTPLPAYRATAARLSHPGTAA